MRIKVRVRTNVLQRAYHPWEDPEVGSFLRSRASVLAHKCETFPQFLLECKGFVFLLTSGGIAVSIERSKTFYRQSSIVVLLTCSRVWQGSRSEQESNRDRNRAILKRCNCHHQFLMSSADDWLSRWEIPSSLWGLTATQRSCGASEASATGKPLLCRCQGLLLARSDSCSWLRQGKTNQSVDVFAADDLWPDSVQMEDVNKVLIANNVFESSKLVRVLSLENWAVVAEVMVPCDWEVSVGCVVSPESHRAILTLLLGRVSSSAGLRATLASLFESLLFAPAR